VPLDQKGKHPAGLADVALVKGVSHGLLTFYETVFFGASRQMGSPGFCSPSGQVQTCDFK
jgi:hypothetical protein